VPSPIYRLRQGFYYTRRNLIRLEP